MHLPFRKKSIVKEIIFSERLLNNGLVHLFTIYINNFINRHKVPQKRGIVSVKRERRVDYKRDLAYSANVAFGRFQIPTTSNDPDLNARPRVHIGWNSL